MSISLRLTVRLYMSTYPIFFITHDALRRVSAFLFSYSGLSSFVACFHANSAVVFLLNSSYFVLLTGACPCLTGSLAVQHVSVLCNDFSHTFPHVMSFSLTPFLPHNSLFIFAIRVFFCFQVFFPVFRSLSCSFTRRSCYHFFWSRCAHRCW